MSSQRSPASWPRTVVPASPLMPAIVVIGRSPMWIVVPPSRIRCSTSGESRMSSKRFDFVTKPSASL